MRKILMRFFNIDNFVESAQVWYLQAGLYLIHVIYHKFNDEGGEFQTLVHLCCAPVDKQSYRSTPTAVFSVTTISLPTCNLSS